MKTVRSTYQYLLLLALFFAAGCIEDPIITDPPKAMKDLVVPSSFSFRMTKSVQLSILLPATVSYSSSQRIVEIWDTNDQGKPGKLINTGAADNTGIYEVTLDIENTTQKIFTNCFAGWRSVTFPTSGAKGGEDLFAVDYNIGYGNEPPKAEPGNYVSPGKGIELIHSPLKSGNPNILKNGDFSIREFDKIDSWSSISGADTLWHVTDEAKEYGSIISEEGNSFARINFSQYCAGGFTQVIRASPGQMITFSGDARGFDSQQDIYLFLIPRLESGQYIDFYSFNMVNPGNSWVNGTVAGTMPEGTAYCQILFYKRSTGIVDFDNAVVHVIDIGSDLDQDGVFDCEDSYPDDQHRAFDDYYPAKNRPGTYVFEDTWPATDDFDFNDLVVNYQIKRIFNGNNQVVALEMISQIKAIGSGIRNGFGFQIYIGPERIDHIETTIEGLDPSIILNANGTESGQDMATFILFSDVAKSFPHTQEGSPTINTTMGYYFVVPMDYHYLIVFKQPVDRESVGTGQINPFLFRTTERSREVHLPDYPPTSLANTSLFGTSSDESIPGSGIYYRTKNGTPWAMNFPVVFEYPVESADLLKAHLKFGDWAASGGSKYSNWYLDESGYRNWDFVYRW